MEKVKELFEMYKDVDDEKLFENLKYFLERIMPVCNKYDIKMAIHTPMTQLGAFSVCRELSLISRIYFVMMKMVDDVHNGVTFCSGSYGTNLENDFARS